MRHTPGALASGGNGFGTLGHMRLTLAPAVLLCAALLTGCSGEETEAVRPPASGAGSASAAASPTADESTSQAPVEPTPVQFRVVRATGNSRPGQASLGDFREEFAALDCGAAPQLMEVPAQDGQVSCDAQQLRYLLEPAALEAVVDSVDVAIDESGNPLLTVTLDSEASRELQRLTSELADTNTPLAVVVNGFVVTAPVVTSPIEGGILQIAGGFSEAEAQDLVQQLTIGE